MRRSQGWQSFASIGVIRLGADADFAAAFAERKDFAGIKGRVGIESVVDAAHEIEIGVGEKKRHELGLFHADAMFTGERAPDFHTIADDFRGGMHCSFELGFVAGIVEDDGMKVAVSGMENIADIKAVLRADLPDAAESLRKFCARNDAIEDVVAGSEAAESAKSVLAAFPEELALGVVTSKADFASAMSTANFVDGGGLGNDSFCKALDFEEENGSAVARESGVDEIFDDADRPAVEHFASGGSDGAGGDVHNGFRGIIHGIEDGEERFDGFAFARKLHGDLGDEG